LGLLLKAVERFDFPLDLRDFVSAPLESDGGGDSQCRLPRNRHSFYGGADHASESRRSAGGAREQGVSHVS